MPAPSSLSSAARSQTMTGKPAASNASAAVNPPIPAPAMTIVRLSATRRSGGEVAPVEVAGRVGHRRGKIGAIAVNGRAVRADDLVGVAHVDEDMRVVERRRGSDTHEFLDAHLNG